MMPGVLLCALQKNLSLIFIHSLLQHVIKFTLHCLMENCIEWMAEDVYMHNVLHVIVTASLGLYESYLEGGSVSQCVVCVCLL